MQDSLRAALVLHRLPDLGSATYWRLLESFSSPTQVLSQPIELLRTQLKPATCEILAEYQRDPQGSVAGQLLERDLRWLDQHPEVHLLCIDDPAYPALLRQIRRPPALLFVHGDPACLSLPQVAIVGSRNPTPGGSDNARQFARYLAESGFAITSGLALGVDAAAHQGALAASGKTIGVLGTGIDRIYPSRHRDLARDIIATGGALVSEFPLGTTSQAGNFPQRNRIISGLSCGTLVVEAAVQSGSLITARLALEQNREVFAIPGSIHNPLARGCHRLIREGAKLVETGLDIVEELGALLEFKRQESMAQEQQACVELAPVEQTLLAAMGFDPVDMDTLAERTSLDIGAVAAQLVGLELKGVVGTTSGGYIRLHQQR
jgi:DNA processing protein